MLDMDTLQTNVKGIQRQLGRFLNFTPSLPNAAEMVNNFDWFQHISFLDFIRDTGKHITVNYMMSKDSVKKRIDGESGMSFTEFTYQLIQGYDFFHLYSTRNCKLQMGGSDQWGNIVTGTELIRRKAGGEAFAFTCPLIKKADGTKFGKTEQGTVWLDPARTTPYQFYQFWLNTTDIDAESYLKIFTFLDKQTIDAIIAEHQPEPGARKLQKKLAEEVTLFIHGPEAYQEALETTEKLFLNQHAPAESLSKSDLENMQGVIRTIYQKQKIDSGIDIISFLTETSILPSKGEARKMIQNGGISINRKKADDVQATVNDSALLHEKYILVQKGKKNYYLVEVI